MSRRPPRPRPSKSRSPSRRPPWPRRRRLSRPTRRFSGPSWGAAEARVAVCSSAWPHWSSWRLPLRAGGRRARERRKRGAAGDDRAGHDDGSHRHDGTDRVPPFDGEPRPHRGPERRARRGDDRLYRSRATGPQRREARRRPLRQGSELRRLVEGGQVGGSHRSSARVDSPCHAAVEPAAGAAHRRSRRLHHRGAETRRQARPARASGGAPHSRSATAAPGAAAPDTTAAHAGVAGTATAHAAAASAGAASAPAASADDRDGLRVSG